MEVCNSKPYSGHRTELEKAAKKANPYLIYQNVDKPDKTVGTEQAIQRLRLIAGITTTPDESSALRTAVDVRNKIVHHNVDEAVANLKLVFARILGFLNDFHRKHLDEPLQDALDKALWQDGVKIKEYGEELYRRAKEHITTDDLDESSLITCPKCGWEALSAWGKNQDTCYVCGHIEHLVVCERCQKTMIFGEHEEHSSKNYCWDCLVYITDDYCYEQAHGK